LEEVLEAMECRGDWLLSPPTAPPDDSWRDGEGRGGMLS